MPLRVAGSAIVKWLGGGTVLALLLGGGAYLYHDWQTGRMETRLQEAEQQINALEANRDHWRLTAREFQSRAERLEAEREAAQAAVRSLQEELQEQEAEYDALRARIREAPEEDDGPVAPVLRETLEALP